MKKICIFVFLVLSINILYVNASNASILENIYERVSSEETMQTSNATTITNIGALAQGSIIVDESTDWIYRRGHNYIGKQVAKVPIYWRKLENNHFQAGSTLFISEVEVAWYPYCFKERGLQSWKDSDIRNFLQTTFYNQLSEKFKSLIVNVEIPYTNLKGEKETVKDNVFLLSIKEWDALDKIGIAAKSAQGEAIRYNDMKSIYIPFSPVYEDYRSETHFYKIANSFLTRTINLDHTSSPSSMLNRDVWTINNFGSATSRYWDGNLRIRPAVNLKSTTMVQGPYKYTYKDGKIAFEYYVLR